MSWDLLCLYLQSSGVDSSHAKEQCRTAGGRDGILQAIHRRNLGAGGQS